MAQDKVERTCIVTQEKLRPKHLIRFVVGPENTLVPDIKCKLPGRGVWVSAKRSAVAQAANGNLIARRLKKKKLQVPKDLVDLVDTLLAQAAIGALGFAKKAGLCITGADKVTGALRKDRAIAVLHSLDGAEDGIRKISQAAYAASQSKERTVPAWCVFTSTQMNLALGTSNVIHAALLEGGAAQNCLRSIARLARYREMEPS